MFNEFNGILLGVSLFAFAFLFYRGLLLLKNIKAKWLSILNDLHRYKAQVTTDGNSIHTKDILQFQNRLVFGTQEHIVEALPGYFLILGLLGTFIGLSIALQHMQGDNQDKTAVIKALGVKFGSSILGILCNVTFRYVKDYYYNYQKIYQECLMVFEEIKHLNDIQEIRLVEQNEISKQRQFETFFNDLLTAHAKDLKEERNNWGHRYMELSEVLKSSISDVNNTLSGQINNGINGIKNQILVDNKTIVNELNSSNNFQVQVLNPIIEDIQSNLKQHITETKNVKQQIFDSGNAMIQFLEKDRIEFYEKTTPIFNQITESLRNIHSDTTSSKNSLLQFSSVITSLTEELGNTTLKFTTAANDFKNAVIQFESNTGDVLLKIGKIVDTSAEQMKEFSEKTEAIFSGKGGVIAILASLKEELTRVIVDFKKSLTEEIQELNRNMNNLEKINSLIKESQIDLSSALELLKNENKKLERVIRMTQSSAKELHENLFGSENEQGRIANSIEKSMLKIIQKDDNGLAHNPLFGMQDRLDEIAGWSQKIERAKGDLNHIFGTKEPSFFTKLAGIEEKIAELLLKIQDEPNQLPIAHSLRTIESSIGNLKNAVETRVEVKPKSTSRKSKQP